MLVWTAFLVQSGQRCSTSLTSSSEVALKPSISSTSSYAVHDAITYRWMRAEHVICQWCTWYTWNIDDDTHIVGCSKICLPYRDIGCIERCLLRVNFLGTHNASGSIEKSAVQGSDITSFESSTENLPVERWLLTVMCNSTVGCMQIHFTTEAMLHVDLFLKV